MSKISATRLRGRFVLVAISAVLAAACVTNAEPIPAATDVGIASPTELAATPSGSLPEVTTSAPPVGPSSAPSLGPSPTPFIVWLPPYLPLPPTTLPATPPPATPEPVVLIPTVTGNARPTHLVIPALGIDLVVVKGTWDYPLCNVAQYLTDFVNPGQPGTTYIYAHARRGMFLPLLNRSKINDGASLIGMKVYLYTADKKLHLYRINIVKRHVRDFSLAYDLEPGQHRLIMQTSEGINYTYPKLQVAAKPIGVYLASAADALPKPHPRVCG